MRRTPLAAVLVVAIFVGGCAQQWVTLRSVPRNPLGDQLKLTSYSGPQPSGRTMQLLRVYDLTNDLSGDSRQLLEKLQRCLEQEPTADKVYAMAELAYLGGKKLEPKQPTAALDMYGASVLHSYRFLFDNRFATSRNCYDPQFRGACDLYNSSLEAALRIICKNKELKPGTTRTIHTAAGAWDITCAVRGGSWRVEDFDHFEFVSDYEMKGLTNHYQTHGLGVPLIAIRKSYTGEPAAARYYQPDLSFPVTAFLRPLPDATPDGARNKGALELCDPLAMTDTMVDRLRVPLEADLTTPLAYSLSKVRLEDTATTGLLHPDQLLAPLAGRKTLMGLYMVQPYERDKIPVVLVHGLWSSPMTWMEMFNDLRSSPDIRRHFQFWFYLYPTGQPFWISAAQLRRDLAEVRQVVDPEHQAPALDQMILVGHSMGGLVARMQTLESNDSFWNLASHLPADQVKADPDTRARLQDTFFFHPSPSIRRVVTIATPHHGSKFSNQTTQYLLGRLIDLPATLASSQQALFRDNKDLLFYQSLLKIKTSIDSLSPNCPILPVMLATPRPPWVKYHNVVGLMPPKWWLGSLSEHTDGVVSESSARVEGVESEIVVPADHTTVHCHPLAVMEVRRILHEHLAELRGATETARLEPAPGMVLRENVLRQAATPPVFH